MKIAPAPPALLPKDCSRLVLSREETQGICVSGPCVIRVTSLSKRRARIAIEAHKTVQIVREELASHETLIQTLVPPPGEKPNDVTTPS